MPSIFARVQGLMSRGFSGGKQVIKSRSSLFILDNSSKMNNFLYEMRYWQIVGGGDHFYFFGYSSDRRSHHNKQ